MSNIIDSFLFPRLSRLFFLRIGLLILSAYLLFAHVLIPMRVSGYSMVPTYQDGEYAFYWRPSYLFTSPERGDVVAIRLAGRHIVLLKRVLGLPGDTITFSNGQLLLDGDPVDEPYISARQPWTTLPLVVPTGKLFVVGDNRNVEMTRHRFGLVNDDRVMGKVAWQ